jgi:hypothetical protein
VIVAIGNSGGIGMSVEVTRRGGRCRETVRLRGMFGHVAAGCGSRGAPNFEARSAADGY